MSEWNRTPYTPGPCNFCGKPKGAFLGNSTWGHSHMCCSSECGNALSEAFQKNEATLEYRKLEEMKQAIEEKMNAIRWSGVPSWENQEDDPDDDQDFIRKHLEALKEEQK